MSHHDLTNLVSILPNLSIDMRDKVARLIRQECLTYLVKPVKESLWKGVAALHPSACQQMMEWCQEHRYDGFYRSEFDKIPLIKRLRGFGVFGLKDAKDIIEGQHFSEFLN